MDLTFLPLPNDVCSIIAKMKTNIEMEPILKKIRERRRIKYKYIMNYDVPYTRARSSGVERLIGIDPCGNKEDYIYTKNSTVYRLADKQTISWIKGELNTVHDCSRITTNAIKTNPATLVNLRAHMRDNKVKGYSKLRKDELRTLCLSF